MKTTIKKLGLSAAVATLLMTTQSFALFGVGDIVYDPVQTAKAVIEYDKQYKRWVKTLDHYRKEVKSMKNQFLSYKMMLQNIGKLPETQWRQFQNQVLQLKRAVEFGQSISYTAANFDQKFRNTFKGFDQYLQQAHGGNLDFTTEYKNMYQSTKDTVQGALKSLKLQEQDLQSDETVMVALQRQSQSAVGQLSAVQAANQIALHQTTQFKKLQKTIMTQANLQAEWIAKKNEDDAMRTAARDAMRRNREKTTDTDDVPMP